MVERLTCSARLKPSLSDEETLEGTKNEQKIPLFLTNIVFLPSGSTPGTMTMNRIDEIVPSDNFYHVSMCNECYFDLEPTNSFRDNM